MTYTPTITLYQFQLCPFCHKVRAALELKGVDYTQIEVAPGRKRELPALPEDAPKKVPVLKIGEQVVWDSTEILKLIDTLVPTGQPLAMLDEHGEINPEMLEFEDWVDQQLMTSLPTVIYDSWGNSFKAARITATASNFNWRESLTVKIGGSIIMRMIAKKILKRVGRTDGQSWFTECLDQAEERLTDREFVMGSEPSIADAALHGAFKCVEDFPVFQQMRQRPALASWFDRVQDLRSQR